MVNGNMNKTGHSQGQLGFSKSSVSFENLERLKLQFEVLKHLGISVQYKTQQIDAFSK